MADEKKSVLLYCDIIHTVEKLSDQNAGELFKHYLRYVNDLNPETDNEIVDLVFEGIKQNLKRDLKKWKVRKQKYRDAGLRSAEVKKVKNNLTSLKDVKQPSKTSTVNVNDTVNVIVNDILLEKETKELFNVWLDYRKEIKKPIKSEKTLISLAKKIQSNGFQKSNSVIYASIQNQWQGLFWDKEIKNEKTINRQSEQTIMSNANWK